MSVNCASDNQGSMFTWVDTKPGAVISKKEQLSPDGRFAIDTDSFYLFSSNQPAMMPGNIAIRGVRIDAKVTNDAEVLAHRARDKV